MEILFTFVRVIRFVLRLFGSVLGVAINEKHLTKLSPAEAAPLWVSNHVSPFDRLVLQVGIFSRFKLTMKQNETF